MDNLPQENATPPAPITQPTNNTQNTETKKSSFDFSENSIIAALSYVGPLIIIPYLTNREDPFTHFHLKQGLVLVIIEIILWVLGMPLFMFYPIISIVNLGLFILSIIGILNTLQRKEVALPLVGKFADQIKL